MIADSVPVDLVEAVKVAEAITFFTGAGMSESSGLPTFRDPTTGLWARHDPALLATREAWGKDSAQIWWWYETRRAQIAAAEPN